MAEQPYDLWFDPNAVGGDLVAQCWISHGPRADDEQFDPGPGDQVTVGDDDEPSLPARVIKREGDRVWVQIQLDADDAAVA
jgi:hypothetical protein